MEPLETGKPRWPRVVGTIGVVAGAVMFLDKFGDLLWLPKMDSVDWWTSLVGEELAAEAMGWLPSASWVVSASLIGMTLGVLLVVGALRLRRGRRSGVALCRAWAWLAIVWLGIEIGAAMSWVAAHATELTRMAGGDWRGEAVFTFVVVIAVLAAFPVFLLGWFSRPGIRAQFAGWPQ